MHSAGHNKRAVFAALACVIILTLICTIKIVQPNQRYYFSGQRTFDDGNVQTNVVVYEGIRLPAGVYKVSLAYQTDTDLKHSCSVQDGTVFTGGLLTNGDILYKNLTKTNYHIWLFENTDALQVTFSYGGQGYANIGDLEIIETNGLWTMLLTIIWGLFFAVIGFMAVRKHIEKAENRKEKISVIFGLAVIILIASLPFLLGGVRNGADATYHLQRIEGVKDGLLSGTFPTRLEPEWLYGHGYANGIFYCNALLLFPAILRLLGFTITASYSAYGIAINIATACIAYYCFKKIYGDSYIGLLCSALYTLSILRIYKFVISGAVGEGSAVTFMPLVMYGFYRAFSEDVRDKKYKTVWIPIAIGYAGLIQTHVLSCEIAAFLTIIICILFVKKIFVRQTFRELAKGAAAAVAMSLWYLVPFIDYYINEDVHIHHVSARTIQDRGLYIPWLFLNWWKSGSSAVLGDMGTHVMGIGCILGIGFAAFCILWFCGKLKTAEKQIIVFGKVSCIIGAMLMLMSLNIFPWDKIQHIINGVTAALVSSFQFPNRFLGWGTTCLVAVCGCLLWYFKKNGRQWYYYLGVSCILAGCVTSNVYLIDDVCQPMKYLYLYNEECMGCGYISGAEYLVEGTKEELLSYNLPATGDAVQLKDYKKKYLHVWLTCSSEKESYIELPILHYKGYRAYDMSTGGELQVEKGSNNVVKVIIPAGFDGKVEVKFVSPIYWRLSEIVTYSWWLATIGVCVGRCRRKLCEGRQHA